MKLARMVALIVLASSTLFAQSPFDGKWQLNQQKSSMAGQTLNIEDAGNGAIKFVNPAYSYTVKTDGSKATTPGGGTETILKKSNDSYHETSWMKGKETGQSDWTISDGGKTLTIHGYGTYPNGEKYTDTTKYTRVSGNQGLAGEWKVVSTQSSNSEKFTMNISGQQLTWDIPAIKATLKVPLDGKEVHPVGPTVPEALTLAVSRKGPRTLEITEKLEGKTLFTGTYTVAPDGKTMTVEGKNAKGEPTKQVWEKQG